VALGKTLITPGVRRPTSPPVAANPAAHFDPLTPTIFHEEWWLDAATGSNYDVAEVRTDGRVVGRLPFSVTRRFGIRVIRMPALTYFLGPAIDDGEGGLNTRFLKRLKITRELIDQLPSTSFQYVKCQRGTGDVIAFQELGFRTHVQFTYEIEPTAVDTLWGHLRNKTRNMIRKAEEQFTVTQFTDPDSFVRLFGDNLSARNLQTEIDSTLCRKIISACVDRERGKILIARNDKNQIVAANFCVWDATSAYYLLSTRSQNSGNSVGSLLLWEAIKYSLCRGLVFDFAGLGNKGSVLLYSGFGGSVSPRYVAVRSQRLARMLVELKSFWTPENCFY
jgi:hypothetical protein